MDAKFKMDYNIREMTLRGETVLEYTEGYADKSGCYEAWGLVRETDGTYSVYSVIQPLDYRNLKDEETRWTPVDWASGYETYEEAKAEYDDGAKRITGHMTYKDMEEEVECCVRYRGVRVTRDGYNW